MKPRLYASIDRATFEGLSAPNLAANLDVISVINTALDPGYASVKSCKRLCLRIRGGHQNVQVLSLHIACLCVRHCGEVFSRELAKSELLKEMGRIGDRSRWAATDIQRMVLHLLQEWAFEVKNMPDFQLMYNYLRSKNAPFEPRDGPMSRIFQPYPGVEQQLMQMQHNDGITVPNDNNTEDNGRSGSRASTLIGPDLLRPGRSPDVLKSDLEVARGTVSLLQEVMSKIRSEKNWEGIQEEYCLEVSEACGAVQKRIETLLGSDLSEDESLVSMALEVNDLAQSALKQREDLVEICEGKRDPPEDEDCPVDEPDAAVPDAAVQEAPPLIDLLDLDYAPEPVTSDARSTDKNAPFDPFSHLEPMQDAADGQHNPFAETDDSAPEGNAFLQDDAFAPVISSGGTSSLPIGSGNPFADDSGDVDSKPRPSTLEIPVNPEIRDQGPFSAPVPGQRHENGFSVPKTSTGHSVFPQNFGHANGSVPRRHTTDAFAGLVDMHSSSKEAPPPPRGKPMKSPTAESEGAQDAFEAFDNISSSKS